MIIRIEGITAFYIGSPESKGQLTSGLIFSFLLFSTLFLTCWRLTSLKNCWLSGISKQPKTGNWIRTPQPGCRVSKDLWTGSLRQRIIQWGWMGTWTGSLKRSDWSYTTFSNLYQVSFAMELFVENTKSSSTKTHGEAYPMNCEGMFVVVLKLRSLGGSRGKAGCEDPHWLLPPASIPQRFQNVHLETLGAPGMFAVCTCKK